MNKNNKYLPCIILVIVSVLWVIMFPYFREDFLNQFYYMPFLGIIGATVANITPAAAGIVYFPILTKLQINPVTAVQFSLIIQAYGMGLGTFRWFLVNKKLFIANVIPICLVGGIAGVFISIVFIPIDNPEILTLIFNLIAFGCTQIIFFSILAKHKYPNVSIKLTLSSIATLFFFSLLGGLVTGWIGFGIDTMFYFILTVVFKINPAISIVTSISLMAAVSFAGTLLNMIFGEIPFSLWYSAVPGVTVAGLFLAAYIAVKIGAKNVLIIFTTLLSIDFFMTLWTQHTIPMSHAIRMITTYILITYLLVIHIKIFKQSYKQIDIGMGKFKKDDSKYITSKFSGRKKPRR